MTTFRTQLLRVFGIDGNFFAVGNPLIQLQREDENYPFAEIVTDQSGHTTLRVGCIQPERSKVITVCR